jgi:hypothetical protein
VTLLMGDMRSENPKQLSSTPRQWDQSQWQWWSCLGGCQLGSMHILSLRFVTFYLILQLTFVFIILHASHEPWLILPCIEPIYDTTAPFVQEQLLQQAA